MSTNRADAETARKLLAASCFFAMPLLLLLGLCGAPVAIILGVMLYMLFANLVLIVWATVEGRAVEERVAESGTGEVVVTQQGRPSLQFDLRDVLLVFVFVATSMGLMGTMGTIVVAYLLFVICMTRIFFSRTYSSRVWALIVGVFFGMCLAPLIEFDHREKIYRARCRSNFRSVAFGLHRYHEETGHFPMAHKPDNNGVRSHSWRVELLPQLDCQQVFDDYDYNEAWDGPNNAMLAGLMPFLYTCPTGSSPPPTTDIVAITGPRTAWPEDRPMTVQDIQDGTSKTIVMAEVANSGIHWMEPRDLTMADIARGIQPQGGVGVSSGHESGAHVVFADGHVQLMSKDTSPEVLRSLATIDGSEPYDPQEEERNRQTKAAAREASRRNAAPFTFVLMIISGLILAFRPLRKLGEEPESFNAQPKAPA